MAERVMAPRGSRVKLHELVENLQTAVDVNQEELERRLYQSFGVFMDTSTALEPTKIGSNQVRIGAGYGLTSSFDMIQVSEIDPVNDRTVTIPLSVDSTVYIQHSTFETGSVQILDGFVFTESGTQFANTASHDYYAITLTDPGASGIELATVTWSGSEIIVADTRSSNLLEIADYVLSADAQSKLHTQNTDTGTTAVDYKVGVGTLGNSLEGLSVVVQDAPPEKPFRPRITNIDYITNDGVALDGTMEFRIPNSVRNSLVGPMLDVTFEWGFDYLIGTGGTSGQFSITGFGAPTGSEYLTFSGNELVGYRLYLSGTDYAIVSNGSGSGATTLTVHDVDTGTPPNLTGINGTSGSPARIHSDADEYYVQALPYDDSTGGPIVDKIVEYHASYASSPVSQKKTMPLMTGWKYQMRTTSKKEVSQSSEAWLTAGSYNKDAVNITYTDPFTVKLPNISDTGSAVGAVATQYGFEITITGWTDATDFEIVYTTDNAGADFENTNHTHKITSDRKIEIETAGSREYNIKVRPLQGGFVVSDNPLSTNVVSGGGGLSPNDKLISYINVDLYGASVLSGTEVSNDGVEAVIDLAVSGGQVLTTDYLKTKRFVDSIDNVYEITKNTGTQITIQEIDAINLGDLNDLDISGVGTVGNTSTWTGTGDTFTPARVNNRFIYQYTFLNDVNILSIDFDCDVTTGTAGQPAVIRLYQSNYASDAKTLDVSASDFFYSSHTINLDILGSRGNRTMIIDGWDVSGVGNTKRLSGVLTVHYQDKLVQQTGQTTS